MRTLRRCLAVLVLSLQGLPCLADTRILSRPVETRLVYENGLTLTLKAPGALETLTLEDKGMTVSIPEAEMKDISGPDLSKVFLTDAPMDGPATREICVTLEFDSRPYDWGSAFKKVKFYFVGGKYTYRSVSVPTSENTWTEMEKKLGEPETVAGSGWVIPRVLPEE